MIGAIWSCSVEQMREFLIQAMVHFCHNHGLLQIQNRPQWLTIQGGSREYVKRLVAPLLTNVKSPLSANVFCA